MANTIRIKRSVTTNTPASLLQGELAFSESGSPNGFGELFIGTAGSTVTKITTDVATSRGGTAAAPNDPAQDNQTITTGLGIDGAEAGSSGNITISFDPNELTVVAPAAGDYFLFEDTTDSLPKKQLMTSTPISLWGAATGQVNMADFDLNRAVLEDYAVKHQVLSISTGTTPDSATVDCTLGNSAYLDLENAVENIDVFFTNPPASGRYGEINLIVEQGTTARTINFPASVDWKGGAPTLSTVNNTIDVLHFFTVNGGTTWIGTYALEASGPGGTVTSVTAGVGLSDTGTGADPILNLDFAELTDMTASISGTTEFILQNGTTESRKAASEIQLEFFNNTVAEFVSENDTMVVADWNWVLDEDTMTTNSAIHVPTQQSVKAYVDTEVAGALASEMTYKGGYNAATNTPALDTGSPSISIGDMYYVTVAGTFFTTPVNPGDTLIANNTSSDAALEADWDIIIGTEHPTATESVAGIIEIATQAEVDAGASAVLAVTPSYLHNTTFDGGTF